MNWPNPSTVRCADPDRRGLRRPGWRHGWLLAGVLLCAGCSQRPAPPGLQPPLSAGEAAAPTAGQAHLPAKPASQAGHAPATPPPWRRARDWDDYRLQAALRITALNPEGTYSGPVPEPALAIPVLEIELNGDGSVRRIQVLRRPGQALDTVQLAIGAVQRAGPFGPVAHLPKPWRFAETFLFDGQRRFKPRTLDQ